MQPLIRYPQILRPRRAFRPDEMAVPGLEPRVLLSSSSRAALDAGRIVEQVNVPYPTPAGPGERLNIYSPPGPAPPGGRPVIIAIHGGGWRRLDKAGYGDRIASAFVPAGYVVVAPNYVLSAPGHPTWPENLDDLRSVVGWVRTEASMLGINPEQVAAMGESAGGNLAELLGTDPGPSGTGSASTQVEAVLAFSAPADLTTLYAQSPWAGRAAAQFLGGSPQQVPAEYAAASPIDHVAPGDPPMLLVHGLEDPLVPVAQSQAMAAALDAAGVTNQLILVQGGHDLDFPVQHANLTRRLLEFLSATWNDEGTPSRS
jgi:acetyl esterase/lipase